MSSTPAGVAGRGDRRIEIEGLTKRFGSLVAVEDLSFTVEPGRVTGFLGPNGAGKTTTLRMLLGLVRPTAGRSTIGGKPYHELSQPLGVVGAGLENSSFHPGRSARNHLRWVAATHGIAATRVEEVLELVGLEKDAGRRVGGYSQGMRQRLGLATAMLDDPDVVILDEPANGLDPQGIAWLRSLVRNLAAEGRTVLISSHVLSEVQQSVDDVVVIARGRLVHKGSLTSLGGAAGVEVVASDPAALRAALIAAGLTLTDGPGDRLRVATADVAAVGDVAHAAGVALRYLAPAATDLEQTFFRLVAEGERRR